MKNNALKTLWDKEKMLITDIFSFSHKVFIYPFKDRFYHFTHNESLVVFILLSIWTSLKYDVVHYYEAEPHSSVSSIADLRTGGHWFDSRLKQYSFRRMMIVIATVFIPLSLLSVVSTMVMWESNQWLGKNSVWSIS